MGEAYIIFQACLKQQYLLTLMKRIFHFGLM